MAGGGGGGGETILAVPEPVPSRGDSLGDESGLWRAWVRDDPTLEGNAEIKRTSLYANYF